MIKMEESGLEEGVGGGGSRILLYLFHAHATDGVRDLNRLNVASRHGDGGRPARVELRGGDRHGGGGVGDGGDKQLNVVQSVVFPLPAQSKRFRD